jgi:hypothetical protein
MADFSTSVALSFEIDDAELRAARDDIESELGGVSVDIDAGGTGGAVPDGGLDMGTLTDLADERNDILDDILDELESGTFGGGGGGGGGLPIPGFGGGGDGGGFGLLEALGIGSIASGGRGAVGRFGPAGLAIAGLLGANEVASQQAEQQTGITASDAITAGGPGGGAGSGTGFFVPDLIANQITSRLGGGGGGGDGEVPIDVPQILERFQTQSPQWLQQFDEIVGRLNQGPPATTQRDTGIDRTEGGDLRLSRLAGNPSGATGIDRTEGGDRRLARAVANQRADDRADRGPPAGRGRNRQPVDVSVDANVSLDAGDEAFRQFQKEVFREVDRKLRDLNGGPGR